MEAMDRAVAHLREAANVLFITGAGISADSGLPTYRGIGGLYDAVATEEGIPIEVALSGEMMKRQPALTWKYIHQIESACRGATYNRAHAFLAHAETRFERVWVLTQNVDGLHRRAGSRQLIDIHGDVHDLYCTQCLYYRETVDDFSELDPCPRCPDCSGVVRPDVVLFGELLPMHKVTRLQLELSRGFDAVFSIGTSSLFPYISGPVVAAHQRGVPTVEINPAETMVSELVDVRLAMGAAEACDILWKRLDG